MFYNKILKIWVLDPWDYFLISAFIGSMLASRLKIYFSEEASMKRLEESIIKEANKLTSKPSKRLILKSKDSKIQKIYKLALGTRGGQFEDLENIFANQEQENNAMLLAQQIQNMVERLAVFLKERELKGILKIFFKQGRLILELILFKCNIDMTYVVLEQGLSTQLIVITSTLGGVAGFSISWFAAGASLISPPLLISALLLRSFTQQILHQRDYLEFKKMMEKLSRDKKFEETIRAFFFEGENLPNYKGIEMGPQDLEKDSIFKYDFGTKSNEEFEEFIKKRLQEELGLIENPTESEIVEIIKEKVKKKSKGKTVYFRDFIDELSDSDISDLDIIDAEIFEEPIRVRTDFDKGA